MTPLQELIVNRMAELNLSYRDAAARSGGLVSHGTLNYIATGKNVGPFQESTIQGIALAFDLPRSQVAHAAAASTHQPTEFRLPEKATNLSTAQRKVILNMVNALLEASNPPNSGKDHE